MSGVFDPAVYQSTVYDTGAVVMATGHPGWYPFLTQPFRYVPPVDPERLAEERRMEAQRRAEAQRLKVAIRHAVHTEIVARYRLLTDDEALLLGELA